MISHTFPARTEQLRVPGAEWASVLPLPGACRPPSGQVSAKPIFRRQFSSDEAVHPGGKGGAGVTAMLPLAAHCHKVLIRTLPHSPKNPSWFGTAALTGLTEAPELGWALVVHFLRSQLEALRRSYVTTHTSPFMSNS